MKSSPSYFKVLGLVTASAFAAIFVIWGCLGRDAAEKIGTGLFMPSGFLWLMLVALAIQLWPIRKRENRPVGGVATLLCCVVYSLAGSGIVADALASALEAPYLHINPFNEPAMDTIIVLGGGGGLGANGRLQGNGSGDRMILAAQLYHQHPTTKFICTGQRIESMSASGVDPAETSRDILVRLGVPDASIELSGGKNTSEEMLNLGKRFNGSSERIGLLTSAWHLPRASRLAAKNGLVTIPLPADFRSEPFDKPPTAGKRIESLIPNGGAFGSTWAYAKEFLGMLLGR